MSRHQRARSAKRNAWRKTRGTRLDELVARRTKMAEAKIAQAETQAVADVRAAAADAAIAAATRILRGTAKGKIADDLITRCIGEVKSKLN